MSNYKIRAHHAMCLQFFCGKGYNDSFVKNMKDIADSLSENPMVTIIDHRDDICSECPNCVNNEECQEQEKVNVYDSKVLQYCSLESGSVMHWKDFQEVVYKNILSAHKRKLICNNCQWNDICENYKLT